MKTCASLSLVAIVGLALTSDVGAATVRFDEPYAIEPKGWSATKTSESYGVTWKQTKAPTTNQQEGGLGASVKGHFPAMSAKEASVGCGLDWSKGQLHAGFDAGDGGNGVGGGFTWLPNAMSGIVGVHFRDTKVNLNLTIADDNQVIFSVDGKEFDWNKVIEATKKEKTPKTKKTEIPGGPDAGPVQYIDGRPVVLDVPQYHNADGSIADGPDKH